MIAKRERKQVSSGEPASRFYVRKWHATRGELSAIRHFVQEKKYRKNLNGRSVTESKTKKIREKLVR